MPKRKDTFKDSPDYKAEQKTSKQNLKDLVLKTQAVKDTENTEFERVNKLENNWTAKSLYASTISFVISSLRD